MGKLFGDNQDLAVSYLESFPSGPAEGDFPENLDYARAGMLVGFGDALFVCGTKVVNDFEAGTLKLFASRNVAYDFIDVTTARWAKAAKIDDEVRGEVRKSLRKAIWRGLF